MTVKDVLALKAIKTAMQGYVIVTIFHANKAYDMDDKLLNCKVEDWELEWNTLLNIYLADNVQIKGVKPCLN